MKSVNKTELAVVITIQALVWASMSLLVPIIPLYFTSINITSSLIGGMIAVSWVGMIFGESYAGMIADKIGLKIPFCLATFLSVLLIILLVFTHNILLLFVISFFWGIFRSAVFGPARSYIANACSLSQKTTLTGIGLAIESLAGSLGALSGGFIADSLGYHWDFYAAAGISLLAGILVIAGLPKIRFIESNNQVSQHVIAKVPETQSYPVKGSDHFKDSFILQFLVTTFCWWGTGVTSFLPLLAAEIPGISATQIGLLFTVIGFVQAALYIPMGKLADRRGKTILMLIGLILLVVDFGSLAFIRSFPLLVLFSFVFSLSMAMFSPAAIALISDTVPHYWQNTALGIYGAAEDIGFILGSGLGGIAWSAWGSFSFLLAAGSSLLGAIIIGSYIRSRSLMKFHKEDAGLPPRALNDG